MCAGFDKGESEAGVEIEEMKGKNGTTTKNK
jgi:hypothetical protein